MTGMDAKVALSVGLQPRACAAEAPEPVSTAMMDSIKSLTAATASTLLRRAASACTEEEEE